MPSLAANGERTRAGERVRAFRVFLAEHCADVHWVRWWVRARARARVPWARACTLSAHARARVWMAAGGVTLVRMGGSGVLALVTFVYVLSACQSPAEFSKPVLGGGCRAETMHLSRMTAPTRRLHHF